MGTRRLSPDGNTLLISRGSGQNRHAGRQGPDPDHAQGVSAAHGSVLVILLPAAGPQGGSPGAREGGR